MKWLGRLFALLFTLLTALMVFTVYLLHSPNGLQWTYRFASVLVPGELTIDRLDGRLRGPLSLRGVHYRNDNMDLQIAQLDLHWQPGALVTGSLQIDDLAVVGLHIVSAPSTAKNNALPDILLPISVKIDHATLHDFSSATRDVDGSIILTDAILSNAEFKQHQLQLQRLTLTAPHYRLSVTGDLTPQRTYPMDLSIDWSADGGEYGKLAGQGRLSGDLQQLKIHHQLTAPVRAVLDGVVSDALSNLTWQADLSAPEIKLQTLRAQWPALTLGGKIHGKGNLQRIQAEGELNSHFQSLSADHRFALVYEKDTLRLSRFDTTLAKSDARLSLHGTLTGLAQQARVDLEGDWQGLNWPLQGEAALRSDVGHFTLAGTLDSYHLQAKGGLAGHRIPSSTWSLSADGTPQALTVTQLEGKLLEGSLTANGKLALQAPMHWDAALQGSHLNPGAQWPDWPGQLAFTAHGSGDINDGSVRTHIELSSLQGKLKNFPVDGDGAINIDGDRFDLSKLRIDAGGNHFIASGSLQDTWMAQWQITATDLAPLLPGAAGRLQGSGGISGPRDNPMFSASLIGQQLHVADKHVGEIDLVMAVDTQGLLPSMIQIEAHDATFGASRLESLRLRGDGNARHHQLQLSAMGASAKAAITISGSYQRQQWTGTVDKLDIDAPVAGRWQLAEPAQAALDPSSAHLDELCLRQEKAHLCAKAQWSTQSGWKTQASLRAVPLSLFKDWMPSGIALAGSLDADAQADNAAGLITGKADVRLKAGVVHPTVLGKGETGPSIVYHQTHLTIILDNQSLTTKLQAALSDGGAMEGSLAIERIALPAPLGKGQSDIDTALFGQLHGDIKELSLLPALIPGVEHTQGRLFTTLTITGSLDKPRAIGEVRLENGSATIPALGINPEAITLVAHGDEQGRLRLDVQLRSKGGTLRLGGDLHYDKASGLNIQAQLNGDQAEIMNTPEYHVLASPNIHLSLKGHRIDLDGELFIPEANLRPRDVSGAVSASDDVVIISAEGPPAPETRWLIYSQLRIRLGDFVKFSGFGLKGLLKGDMTLVDTPQQPTVAHGELSIIGGEYHAYGQKLEIDRGRLLFIGGPVDNPGLDILAVRHIQEVTAGITVRGTLKAPQVQLYSEPAMEDTDALSYLLTGQPISQATSSQGQQLYGAALSLGLASGGLLASKIGQRFGIDELTVESGGTFGAGALVIRHYLSPKLYISYGVGLMEHFNIFLMRYQISRRWFLEAESGVQSGADIVYTLERK
jgi:translocation and assembly module TamB